MAGGFYHWSFVKKENQSSLSGHRPKVGRKRVRVRDFKGKKSYLNYLIYPGPHPLPLSQRERGVIYKTPVSNWIFYRQPNTSGLVHSSFIPHPSSFIPHPSSFILHRLSIFSTVSVRSKMDCVIACGSRAMTIANPPRMSNPAKKSPSPRGLRDTVS